MDDEISEEKKETIYHMASLFLFVNNRNNVLVVRQSMVINLFISDHDNPLYSHRWKDYSKK